MNRLDLKGLILLCLLIGLIGNVSAEEFYVVQRGDTLTNIAEKFYGDHTGWRYLYQANRDKLKDERSPVPEGTRLVIPELNLKTAPTYRTAYDRIDEATGLAEIDLVAISDFTPFTSETLRNGGIVTELVDIAFRNLGYKPVVRFAKTLPEFGLDDIGEFTAAFPYIRSQELDRNYLLSSSVFDLNALAYWRGDFDFEYASQDDLLGRTVCLPAGHFADFMDELLKDNPIVFHQQNRPKDCFVALMRKNVDVVIVDELDGELSIHEMGVQDQVRVSGVPVHNMGLYAVFPKYSSHGRALRYQFNRAISELAKSGELDHIVRRHLEPDTEPASEAAAVGSEELRKAFESFLEEEAPNLADVLGSKEERDALFQLFQRLQER